MTITLQRHLKSGHPDGLTAICHMAHSLDEYCWRNRAPDGRDAGRRRAYYALTPDGRRATIHEIQTRGFLTPRKPTGPLDETTDKLQRTSWLICGRHRREPLPQP
ncbi:hypothetical protein ACFXA3_26310 [Streptomyces sp. NPDC059456]|uniref:hypothetical protein n=1 Tax=Streptomyces sp. NPDC059456 TaxID=3346838 RepID=UPI0036944074